MNYNTLDFEEGYRQAIIDTLKMMMPTDQLWDRLAQMLEESAIRTDRIIQREHKAPMIINRRGKCERCGCNIDGIGLCASCTKILDGGIVNPDDGALQKYLRNLHNREAEE